MRTAIVAPGIHAAAVGAVVEPVDDPADRFPALS